MRDKIIPFRWLEKVFYIEYILARITKYLTIVHSCAAAAIKNTIFIPLTLSVGKMKGKLVPTLIKKQ